MRDDHSRMGETAVDSTTSLFWFRRDLRLQDNVGLYHALKENNEVVPIFIFDSVILGKLEDPSDKRVGFIHFALGRLKKDLEKAGSSLLLLHGDPLDIYQRINPKAVYTNHDYEPYAVARDEQVNRILNLKGIPFKTYKDQVIFEKSEVTKNDGTPYTIFTPYCRRWKATATEFPPKSYPTEKHFDHLKKLKHFPFPTLENIGFGKTDIVFPERGVRQSIVKNYGKQRDFPALEGTTRLSVHLRFGTVSIRKLVRHAARNNEQFLNELIWREFYHMILWHFPHVATRAFKPAYNHIQWRNDATEFDAWCQGRTGYPIVDAGMRELNATGFMHNRVRMIVASFLTKHLLIDWRWGEAYFAEKLLDFDLASNNGGWQWAAGSGCDAAPYFRVFNPALQTEKFDPRREYIRTWVPEFESKEYPAAIVNHATARMRALKVYRAALERQKIV